MEIRNYLNTSQEEVLSKRFNIFIGISLGNKYFSKENIKEYILWALNNTREDVLVLIADRIHAINYEVFNNYSSARALKVALKKGSEVEESIRKIIRSLPKDQQTLVKIAKWEDVRKSGYYAEKLKIILNEFEKNSGFHDKIIQIVKENLGKKAEVLNQQELDKLAMYVIDELPILLNGVEFGGKIYDLIPYPGLSSLDEMIIHLQAGKIFPKLAKKLEIKNTIAELEAYV